MIERRRGQASYTRIGLPGQALDELLEGAGLHDRPGSFGRLPGKQDVGVGVCNMSGAMAVRLNGHWGDNKWSNRQEANARVCFERSNEN
jgi:hypothetical protein